MSSLPFRWDLTRRSHLGSLLEGESEWVYAGFLNELRECAAKVIAACGDSNLVFVGRSPESLFDYLTGVLVNTSYRDRMVLLNLSMRLTSIGDLARTHPARLHATWDQLTTLGLSPERIERGARPTTFVDLVHAGGTFGHLLELLEHWTERSGGSATALRRRIRFLGITERTRNSPNTWRWYQRVDWARRLPRSALRSVSVPRSLWNYLGNIQGKVARSHPPEQWGAEEAALPRREQSAFEALRLARRIHESGARPSERHRFASLLAAHHARRDPFVRRLVMELRRG